MRRRDRGKGLALAIAVLAAGWEAAAAAAPVVDLSPTRWPASERAAYRSRDFDFDAPVKLARGEKAMIATSSQGGTAVRAGLEALRQGGTAVDAALVTALTQIALVMGAWTSYAGDVAMVVYHAESGQVFSLNGPFNTLLAETDPRSIPKPATGVDPGRAVMVPGFMAAVEAAHDKFGALPWEALFAPAIYFAEEGFEVRGVHLSLIGARQDVLSSRPATRAIFQRSDGTPLQEGDRLRQTALAHTLRRVAAEGAAYMYRGAWAEKLVAAVREEGGRLTMGDMKSYRPMWTLPLRARYRSYEIATVGIPNRAGIEAVLFFNLLEQAKLDRSRPYAENPQTLYWLIQMLRLGSYLTLPPAVGYDPADVFGDLDLSPAARVRPETARAIWERMQRPDWSQAARDAATRASSDQATGHHSDCIVVKDEQGNVVALTHSISTRLWGEIGLFIDGVSIPDVAGHSQIYLQEYGAGVPFPDFINPLIVLRHGKPVVASAAVGGGLHEVTMQNVAAMLDFDLDPRQAIEMPKVRTPYFQRGTEGRGHPAQRVPDGAFSEEVLAAVEAMGQALHRQPAEDRGGQGFWVGLRIDPTSGITLGAAPAMDGYAEGY